MNQISEMYVLASLEDATIPGGGDHKVLRTKIACPKAYSLLRNLVIDHKINVIPIDITVTVYNYGKNPVKVCIGQEIAHMSMKPLSNIKEIQNFEDSGPSGYEDPKNGIGSFCDAHDWECSRIDTGFDFFDQVIVTKPVVVTKPQKKRRRNTNTSDEPPTSKIYTGVCKYSKVAFDEP